MKECTKCGETKPLSDYTFDRAGRGGGRHKSSCKACGAKYMREKRVAEPERAREYVLKYHYGLTLEDYKAMWDAQEGLCAICDEPEVNVDNRYGKALDLAVDHDHSCCPGRKSCGKCLRGLLCRRCNQTLGLIKDDRDRINAMAAYLNQHAA